MADIPVSVVVVSRGRPQQLCRCLTGLSQLRYPKFEIIIVADPAGLAALSTAGWDGRIKALSFDEANISVARNLGILRAAGEIVAFIDDDAVPEPTWLDALIAPFADPRVASAGGFVRSRNGISFQWTARMVMPDSSTHPLDCPQDATSLHASRPDRAIKTEGTNMAIRRSVLSDVGGFDPVYRFYLDETDLNLRLAGRDVLTAIVPRAQVHHGFDASARRRADRVPRSLIEIGASLAAFLRRHAPDQDAAAIRARERKTQRRRLIGHMIAGRLEPRDVRRLLDGFDDGWRDGAQRPVTPLDPLGPSQTPFLPYVSRQVAPDLTLSGRSWQSRALCAQACAAVSEGHRVSLHLLSPTTLRHRVVFDPAGYWVQRGGLFGAADRSDPPVRYWRFKDRVHAEARRVAAVRWTDLNAVEA